MSDPAGTYILREPIKAEHPHGSGRYDIDLPDGGLLELDKHIFNLLFIRVDTLKEAQPPQGIFRLPGGPASAKWQHLPE